MLDYFGSTVNTAARLEHQCRGGEVVVSDAVLADDQARATMRGLSAPVPRRHYALNLSYGFINIFVVSAFMPVVRRASPMPFKTSASA